MAKTYDTYKDSGIAWIGEIPEEWGKDKIFRLFSVIGSGTTPKSTNERNFDGNINWIQSGDINGGKLTECKNKISENVLNQYSTLKIYKAPFIIVAMYGASVGNISFSKIDACVNQACCVMSDSSQCFNFLFYTIKAAKDYLIYRAEGGGQPNISQDKLKNLRLPIPPLSVQQSISSFLDTKCGEIDSLISIQEEMISELLAYKQSVITEAVTKGLDKKAKMKNSGVEWIGDIPEEWEVVKINRLFSYMGGYAFNSNNYSKEETNYQVVRIGNVKNDYLKLEASPVYITKDISLIASKCKLKRGYIIFTMTGTKGKRDYFYTLLLKDYHFKEKELYLNQRVGCFIPISKQIDVRYYDYLLKDKSILDSIFLYETGTANQGNLGIETINRTLLQFPPLPVQQAIATYLDEKTSQIDSLIALKQSKIESLKEYKKSIIYEYVTGKKRV